MSVHIKIIHLEGDLKKTCNLLLKVHKDTKGSSHTITQKVTKEKATDRKLKIEGIDERNILNTKRR